METTMPVEDQGFSLQSSWVAINKEVIPRERGGEGKKRGEKKNKSQSVLALMLFTEIIFYPLFRVTTQLFLEPPPGEVVRSPDKDLCGLFSFSKPLKINRGGNVYGWLVNPTAL